MAKRTAVNPPDQGRPASPPRLLTIPQAAVILGVSEKHIRELIHEADTDRKSRWRFGREIFDLTPRQSKRRTLRLNLAAIAPALDA